MENLTSLSALQLQLAAAALSTSLETPSVRRNPSQRSITKSEREKRRAKQKISDKSRKANRR